MFYCAIIVAAFFLVENSLFLKLELSVHKLF